MILSVCVAAIAFRSFSVGCVDPSMGSRRSYFSYGLLGLLGWLRVIFAIGVIGVWGDVKGVC